MCEDKDCDCKSSHHGKHHRYHHMHHKMGYASIVKRTENEVMVPEVLLEVADVGVGEFLEIRIQKVKKHKHHHHK
ncbi:MAG: hypothetical protein HZC47_00480 [Methanobacterium sp.]|uniref:hypothetical protein n=1 Tax=Methanobacterium sp. TaxID=2164 RepID=UPI003D66275E|nr:hypothetical protein [Methanobacterium sp.]